MKSRIKLGRKLGEGAMGKVYLATYIVDPIHKKTIRSAIKEVPANKMDMKEVQLQANLSRLPDCHEHIACYYDLFQDSNTHNYFIVMEYINGKELWDYLKDNIENITEQKLLDLCIQALKGLEFIHANGIAHGDIKLENFMISNGDDRLKYIDFGFGCSETTCASSPVWHGTRFLSPPEAYRGEASKNLASMQKADLWAVGSLFAELVLSIANSQITRTDEVSMDGKSVSKHVSKHNKWIASEHLPVVSDEIILEIYNIIDALMTPDPKKRSTAKNALKMLQKKIY
jgi:serine/threonine protein kinase